MSISDLESLAKALRLYLQEHQVGKRAHLESSLGVTELSIALHARLNAPKDLLIWDVGHQAYIHKWLTGRSAQLREMRKLGGISGFPNRSESEFDPFGTGHSSTSISALAGLAQADRLKGISRKYVAVIGDGALTGGQAFEALNHVSDLDLDLLLILNDNTRSLDVNVGSLHQSRSYQQFFESLNWNYAGTVDGNRMNQLIPALEKVLDLGGLQVLHVNTRHPALEREQASKAPRGKGELSFSEVFGRCMQEMIEANEEVCVISPAMIESAWLGDLKRRFPSRVIDTGITEQHAVTFSAGLAAGGQRVFCHLYSTFSQRAMDQIIHDVALQNLPVTFVLDRAGITGADGPTHHGVFDLSLLRPIPNMEIWDAADGDTLEAILRHGLKNSGPLAVRIPRADTQWRTHSTKHSLSKVTIENGLGKRGRIVLGHAKDLLPSDAFNGPLAVVHCIKPFPREELLSFFQGMEEIEVWEDNTSIGGLYEAVQELKETPSVRILSRGIPDRFIPHGGVETLWKSISS